jgi:translation initiation factor 3 subunit I
MLLVRTFYLNMLLFGFSFSHAHLVVNAFGLVFFRLQSIMQSGQKLKSVQAHTDVITDMQLSSDRSYFITSSKDKTAQIFESNTLSPLKKYTTDAPLNSAAITPIQGFVILGGGQDAMQVTTTSARQGKFECRIWHKILEQELGRVRGHFGPINTIAVHPDGKSFSSGGEDGYVRVHHFDPDYFKFKYPDL